MSNDKKAHSLERYQFARYYRKNNDIATQICEYDDLLDEHMENYNVETTALRRKLQSKVEALRILRKEYDKFRTERDQFKLMAETLQLRYAALCRNSTYDAGREGNNTATNREDSKYSVSKILNETREHNIKLTTEVETLKQKLSEVQGDIEILRSNKSAVQAAVDKEKESHAAHSYNKNLLLKWQQERSNYLCHLEKLKKKNAQLTFDFKTLIDEKEELMNERDAYKCKAHRLNHELLLVLKAKDVRPKLIDVDSILLENTYQHKRLDNVESEVEITKKCFNKYKSSLESKKEKGIIKLGKICDSDENILSHTQDLPTKAETIQHLKALCMDLLHNLNDKDSALNHQKKTNKVLAAKIKEQLQHLELLCGIECSTESEFISATTYLLNDCGSSTTNSRALNQDKNNQILINRKITPPTECNTYPEYKVLQNSRPFPSEKLLKKASSELATATANSDDAMSSFSTESGRSILSSEYDVVNDNKHTMELRKLTTDTLFKNKTPSSAFDSQKSSTTPYITRSVVKQRNDDLKGLPPELAALVQKALHELDLRDFDGGFNDICENDLKYAQ